MAYDYMSRCCLVICLLLGAPLLAGNAQEPEKAPSLGEAWAVDTRRSLSAEEAQKMVRLLLQALDVDEQQKVRLAVIQELGDKVAHRAVIPVLKHLALCARETDSLRWTATIALSRVGDADEVPALIDLMEKGSGRVPGEAWKRLTFLLMDEDLSAVVAEEEWASRVTSLRQWWAAHGKDFRVPRFMMFVDW